MQEVTEQLWEFGIGPFVNGCQLHLAELNIPYYPLLWRSVDCIIALDASADSQVGPERNTITAAIYLMFDLSYTGLVVHSCRRHVVVNTSI